MIELETISTETDRAEVVNAIKEVAAALIRIEDERSLIKDIKDRVKSEFELKPEVFNKLSMMYHKQNREETEAKTGEVVGLYDSLFKKPGDDE